ncbi:inclusion body family protein [Trinickia sp. LjRoot230]|uniref:AidA/PixA family protein n=1 Tax=Trinickia sp. LjRoot230 TaxID=3342288 RepID=UPI003ED01A84
MSEDNSDATIVNVLIVVDVSLLVDKLAGTIESTPVVVDKGVYMLAEPEYIKSGLASSALVLNVAAEGEDSSTFVRFRTQCVQFGKYQCEIVGISADSADIDDIELPALRAVTYTELYRVPTDLKPDDFNHNPAASDIFWETEMEAAGVVNYAINFMVADVTAPSKPAVTGYFQVKSSINISDPQD